MSSLPYSQISNVFNPADFTIVEGAITFEAADLRYIRQGGPANVSSLMINSQAVDFSSISGVTPGTAANNKALVLGPSGEIGTIASLTATNIYGTLQTGAQGNITSLGTLSGLTIGGNLTFTGVSRSITGLSSITATSITGTLQTASQTGITALGTLSSLTVSGSSNLGSIQIAGTEIITNGRNIYNVGNITCSGVVNAFGGYQVNGSTFADSSRNVFGASIIADYAQLAKTAGSTFSTSLRSNQYNLALSNASNASATFSGLAFHINTQDLSAATPSACITAEKDSATANEGADISFYTKGTAGLTTALTKRMMVSKEGLLSIGSLYNGDGILNVLTEGSATMRFGAAITYRDCFSMSYFHNGPNNDLSRLSFSTYGVNSTLSIQHRRRVGINTDAPESTLHVITSSPALFGSWERVQEWWNDSATPIKAGLIIYNENGGSNLNGISFGTYTNDPINFFVNGSNGMTFNTSKRLNINRSSGPEATVHAGGMIWADELFHSKQNVDGKCVYRSNWSQSNFLGWGTDATVGAMRLGICDASFNWVSYIPVRGGAYTNASDRRIKRDIVDIPYGLNEVLLMKPRKYTLRHDSSNNIGFIAQEMLSLIPECVSGVESPDDDLNDQGEPINPMGIDLASLTAVLCKAIQELKAEVSELTNKINALQ